MKQTILFILTLVVALTGCDKTLHEYPENNKPQEGENIVRVGLNTDKAPTTPLKDVHLFWFDETDKLSRHDYYSSMQELADARLTIPTGGYTIIAVLNTGKDLSILTKTRADLPDISLSDFTTWIKGNEGNYPELLTGTLRHTIKDGNELVYIDIEEKTNGVKDASVELLLTIPSSQMPEYTTRAAANPALRGVAYIYKKGTTELFAVRKGWLIATDTEKEYRMGLSLFKGAYDVKLWVDYAVEAGKDLYYNTNDLQSIICTEPYTGSTDYRDCMYGATTIDLTSYEDNATEKIEVKAALERPLAKYRIIATDVEEFLRKTKKQRADGNTYTITFSYGFYLPTGFNIVTGKPMNSLTGVKYSAPITIPDDGSQECVMGTDFIFVNGTESFVVLTIELTDADGKVVSRTRGLEVPYRRGYQTTVRGKFLTNEMQGGIDIDTDYEGDIDVDLDKL